MAENSINPLDLINQPTTPYIPHRNVYVIKGGATFKDLLDAADEVEKEEDSVEKCLISNEPLDKTKMTLQCNHSFNYVHLYNEVVAQKYLKNMYNGKKSFYKTQNGIECPYCRTFTDCLLPPSIDLKCSSKNYVTSITITSCLKIHCQVEDCEYRPIYVTPLGCYCITHYADEKERLGIKPLKYKNKKMKIAAKGPYDCVSISASNAGGSGGEEAKPLDDIRLAYKANHTQDQMKRILKYNSKPVSGNKTQLTERIFLYNLQNSEIL